MSLDPLYVISGAVVGAIIGLTGVGGGSLMTPFLVLVLGVHPATAVGTDLLFAAATKSVGSIVHGLNRNVAWKVVGLLSAGSAPTAALTIYLLNRTHSTAAFSSRIITISLGLALLVTAFSMLFRRWLERVRSDPDRPPAQRAALTILVGCFLGLLVSITSVGAGALGVTGLLLLYPAFPAAKIVGTDVAHAVPLTLVAGLGHWFFGSVDGAILISLLAGSVPGIIVGGALAPRVPETGLRLLLAIVLALAGWKLLAA
jgi:uncharacterized protein